MADVVGRLRELEAKVTPGPSPASQTLGQRLVSPSGFNGAGPTPEAVLGASVSLAHLHKRRVLGDGFGDADMREALEASRTIAEWLREVVEVRDELLVALPGLLAVVEAARQLDRAQKQAEAHDATETDFETLYKAWAAVRAALDALGGSDVE